MIRQRSQLSQRLKQARLDARLKQEQVARYLKVPVSAVSALETGGRRLDALELFMLSKLYQRPLAWFFGEEIESADRPAPGPMPQQDMWQMLSDEDPILRECVDLLRKAPKELQRSAAYGLIGFLSSR